MLELASACTPPLPRESIMGLAFTLALHDVVLVWVLLLVSASLLGFGVGFACACGRCGVEVCALARQY